MFKRRILLAEDDHDVRTALRDLLEARGFEVEDFGDARGIASYLESGMLHDIPMPRVHAILTDLRMPHMGGEEMLTYFRDLGWDLPTVVVTAFGDAETKRRLEQLGVDAVLDKPFEADDLARTLREVIDDGAAS